MTERPHHLKQVIVLRKDLNMRKGKMAAQASHASMATLFGRSMAQWDQEQQQVCFPMTKDQWQWFTELSVKIVVGVPDEASLLEVHRQAQERGLPCALIQDAGLTEFGGIPTYTAVAVGPAEAGAIDAITGTLPLL